jgi:parallel beta-helix repeat protein
MKVKMTFAVLALAGMLLVLPASSAAESSDVIKVEPGDSIQAAIDAANAGTTIKIEEGTYKESLQINKDGIKLVGEGSDETHLVPPDPLVPGKGCVFEDTSTTPPTVLAFGICVNDPEAQPPVRLKDVRISNLSVTGFSGMGIFLFAVDNGAVKHVTASDDGGYGIFALDSSGTRIYGNVTNNNEEAGVYIGDSPNADAKVKRNVASGNLFGIFIRDAAHGVVLKNRTFGNCLGILFLNTEESPGPQQDVEDWVAFKNRVTENNKPCPASEEAPPISGIGIAVLGGVDISLIANQVLDNKAGSNPTAFVGGISVQASPIFATAKPSTGTRVAFNTALGNEPDLFWDGAGDGNVFVDNECRTSDPAGLCDEEQGNENGDDDGKDDDSDDGKHKGDRDHHSKGDDDDHGDDESGKSKGKSDKDHSRSKRDRDDD